MKRSASMALRRSLPGPRICCCPTNSDRSRGRILHARGGSVGSTVVRGRLCACFLRATVCFRKAYERQVIVLVKEAGSRCDMKKGYCQASGASGSLPGIPRSEEHTSELQSLAYLVC